MNDELAVRVRGLEAERLRPVPRRREQPAPQSTTPPNRLAELLAEVAAADGRSHTGLAAPRHKDYQWLRDQGTPLEDAAAQVGISVFTAYTSYEPLWKPRTAVDA